MLTAKDYKDGKLITMSKAFDTRAKILNAVYFVVFFGMGTFFLRTLLIVVPGGSVTDILFSSVGVLILYVCAFRFANKASLTEKLFVNRTHLTIIQQGLYNSQRQSYEVPGISEFRHLGKTAVPAHPLSTGSFDYLGFQTQQQVINDMYGENRVGFVYEGKPVNFGNNLYSWEFDELEVLLYDVTGDDLRYNAEQQKYFNTKDDE